MDGTTTEPVEKQIVGFIVDDLGWEGDPGTLIADPPARLPQVLDSQDLLELAGFLEYEFGIEIQDQEITADNMGTVPRLADFVARKKAAGGG